jgi:ligand-binding sensor domain-containing protein
LVLLSWPTKWPQYTLVVLPAFCLAASTAIKGGYEWLREQELYWEWFQNMFPRPSRRYIIIGASLLGILIVGALASQVVIAINRLGWSSMSAVTTYLPGDSVNDLLLLPDGRMLVATDAGAAFWRAAGEDDVLDNWEVLNPGNSPLPDAHVLSVAQDQQGTIWFGTASGLASLDGETWEVFGSEDLGLASDMVNAIAVDKRDQVWIGTIEGAAVYDGNDWHSFTSATSGLLNDAIFSIAIQEVEGGDIVWFGTLRGISRMDQATGQWQSYSSQDIDLGWGGVADLFIDSTGRIWVCTEGGGISLWDGISWSYLRVSNSDLPYSIVETVTEIEPGIFWIASSIPNSTGGVVARFDGIDWRTYRQGFSGYSGAETIAIAEDSLGRIWFGTRTEGIDIYEPKK